ncbi:hypothetical protein KIPB_014650, partial [Kipferlia bialata]|eukprot:g14650.t1
MKIPTWYPCCSNPRATLGAMSQSAPDGEGDILIVTSEYPESIQELDAARETRTVDLVSGLVLPSRPDD